MKNDNDKCPERPKLPEIESRFEVMGCEVDREEWERGRRRDKYLIGTIFFVIITFTIFTALKGLLW